MAFNDLMIDLETMGQGPDAAIVSIGAVRFDIATGKTASWMHEPVSLQSSVDAGLKIDPSTLLWWMQQSAEAQASWNKPDAKKLTQALDVLDGLCHIENKPQRVWANAPSFDCVILGTAYGLFGRQKPWSFRYERCMRTLVQLARDCGFDPKAAPRKGVAHDALSDCMEQIEICHRAFEHLLK